MQHAMIAVPAHAATVHVGTLSSLVKATYDLAGEGIIITLSCWAGDSLLPHARNSLVAMFMKSDCTDLVFIDGDISWEPGALTRLLKAPVDFVAGAYRHKKDEESYPVNWIDKPVLWADPETGLLEVEHVPMGFCRLTRAACERLIEAHKDKAYRGPSAPELLCYCLFDLVFENGQYLGEDFVFCRKWRELGGSIWIDPMLKLTHSGNKDYVGTIGDWLRTRRDEPVYAIGPSGKTWPQDQREIALFVELLKEKGVKRYLEIGCRYGDTFRLVMNTIGENGLGVAVDWPGADGLENDGLPFLEKAVDVWGDVLIVGSSQDQKIIDEVRELGPFDAILIDGDHSYAGAMADWKNYGDLAPIVAFHDIVNDTEDVEVSRVWAEVRKGRNVREIVCEGSIMGIGVILP